MMLRRLIYRCVTFKDYAEQLNRKAAVESKMFACIEGKKPMPDKDTLRQWALELGVPECYRVKEPK